MVNSIAGGHSEDTKHRDHADNTCDTAPARSVFGNSKCSRLRAEKKNTGQCGRSNNAPRHDFPS